MRVAGTVVSISGDQIVVKNDSGDNVTVKLAPDVRIRKDRQEAKLSDFKAGDHIMAAGTLGSDKVLTARLVAGGEMGQGGMGRGGNGQGAGMGRGMGGALPTPEEMVKMGLGTKFIAGEVTAIAETKLTIMRPDKQSQTIEVDETTSFKNGKGDSVTLADIKVGDRVMGRGEMKGNVFVPQTLRVGGPERGGPGRGPGGPGAGGMQPPTPPSPDEQKQTPK